MNKYLRLVAEHLMRSGASDEALEAQAGVSLEEIVVLRAMAASAAYPPAVRGGPKPGFAEDVTHSLGRSR